MNYYKLTNDEIVKYIRGEAINYGLLDDGTNLVYTAQTLSEFTPLEESEALRLKEILLEELNIFLKPIRNEKIEELKIIRDEKSLEPIGKFLVKTHQQILDISYAIKYFDDIKDENGQIRWMDLDNNDFYVTKADLEKVELEIAKRRFMLIKKHQKLKDKIMNALNLDEIYRMSWDDEI